MLPDLITREHEDTMSQPLTISDDLYQRLDSTARERGPSIEALLHSWTAPSASQAAAQMSARRARFGAVPRFMTTCTRAIVGFLTVRTCCAWIAR